MSREYRISKHARRRMSARRLRNQPVDAAIRFGRRIHTRKAVFYVIGRKEVEKWNFRGIDLSGFEGIHAVCSADGRDRKSTRLNSSHLVISYAVFCLKKKKK